MTLKQKKTDTKPAKPAKATKPADVAAGRKAAPPRTRPRAAARPDETAQSEDEIRQRAYFLWESRGRPFGSPEVDWYGATEG